MVVLKVVSPPVMVDSGAIEGSWCDKARFEAEWVGMGDGTKTSENKSGSREGDTIRLAMHRNNLPSKEYEQFRIHNAIE